MGVIARLGLVLASLGWMRLIFHFSTQAWGGAHTRNLIEVLLNVANPDLLKILSLQQLELLNFLIRKLSHFTEYAVLACLGYLALRFGLQQPQQRALWLALVCSTLYAFTDEFHQAFVPGRQAMLTDVLIDALGVLVAVLLLKRLPLHPQSVGSPGVSH